MNIIENIIDEDLVGLKYLVDESLTDLIELRLLDLKKDIAALHFGMPIDEEYDLVIEAGRFKIVRAKVRAGKILRRHKEATRSGYTMRGGKVTKMSPKERMNRRRSQLKGKRKRKAKANQSRRSTKKAMRKRRMIGLK